MKPKDIIKYVDAWGKIREAVVADSEPPNSVRIFNRPFDENSKSYVLGLGQKKRSESFLKNSWDYTVTNHLSKEKEEKILENLIKNMGPLSDINEMRPLSDIY